MYIDISQETTYILNSTFYAWTKSWEPCFWEILPDGQILENWIKILLVMDGNFACHGGKFCLSWREMILFQGNFKLFLVLLSKVFARMRYHILDSFLTLYICFTCKLCSHCIMDLWLSAVSICSLPPYLCKNNNKEINIRMLMKLLGLGGNKHTWK